MVKRTEPERECRLLTSTVGRRLVGEPEALTLVIGTLVWDIIPNWNRFRT